jgi:hypothetical protein
MPRKTRRKHASAHVTDPYPTSPEGTRSQQQHANICKVILHVPVLQPKTSTPDVMDELPPSASPPSSPPEMHRAPQHPPLPPPPPLPPSHHPHVPSLVTGHPILISGRQGAAGQHNTSPPTTTHPYSVPLYPLTHIPLYGAGFGAAQLQSWGYAQYPSLPPLLSHPLPTQHTTGHSNGPAVQSVSAASARPGRTYPNKDVGLGGKRHMSLNKYIPDFAKSGSFL